MHSNHAITDRIFRTNQYLLVEYLISKENKRASQYILEYVHLNLEDLRYPIGKINDKKKKQRQKYTFVLYNSAIPLYEPLILCIELDRSLFPEKFKNEISISSTK